MDLLLQVIKDAFLLIVSFDAVMMKIVLLSLTLSIISTIAASIVAIPLGTAIARSEFRGRRAIITLFNTLMAIPTVVIGLLLYGILSRNGPLGALDLLYTPTAVAIGQFLLAAPLITAMVIAALEDADEMIELTALTLGATRFQAILCILREKRAALIAAISLGFGRVITEVGCALIVGGNIKEKTRIMTTAVTLETSKGEFSIALALGIILVIIALGVNILLYKLQKKWVSSTE